jgi:uncharacterized protein YrrD
MQFKDGTNVYTADGDQVGRIDRVVIDPRTKEVSHVVVRKGLLFTEDKVVPLELIAGATEDMVTLRDDAGDLDVLPHFEESHYVPMSEADQATTYAPGYASPVYWYPPFGGAWYGAPVYPEVTYTTRTEQNIPEGTVGLKEGAKVVSADGDHVGNVERIFTTGDRATHMLISQGLLFKEKKLIPTLWISTITEDEVKLGVNSGMLERLPAYEM